MTSTVVSPRVWVPVALGVTFLATTLIFRLIPKPSEDDVTPTPPPAYGTADIHLIPGTYTATVPAGSTGCHWARLIAGTWDADGQIAYDNAAPGETVVVTIAAGDVAFRAQGCGPWSAIESTRPGPLV